MPGMETVVYKVELDGINVVKSAVRTVTDENGMSSLVEEVTLLVKKEKWTAVTVGLDQSGSGASEAEYDQIKRS